MRATLKIVLPLIVSVASVSLVFAGYQVRNQRRILRNDLARRAEILADSLQESIERELGRGQDRGLRRFVERYGQREHLRRSEERRVGKGGRSRRRGARGKEEQ